MTFERDSVGAVRESIDRLREAPGCGLGSTEQQQPALGGSQLAEQRIEPLGVRLAGAVAGVEHHQQTGPLHQLPSQLDALVGQAIR